MEVQGVKEEGGGVETELSCFAWELARLRNVILASINPIRHSDGGRIYFNMKTAQP
jgi:hypothetical protein